MQNVYKQHTCSTAITLQYCLIPFQNFQKEILADDIADAAYDVVKSTLEQAHANGYKHGAK